MVTPSIVPPLISAVVIVPKLLIAAPLKLIVPEAVSVKVAVPAAL